MWVEFENFIKDASDKLGLAAYCKSCNRDYSRDRWHNKTKDEKHDKQYRNKYGITLEQYNQLLADQNFCCAICNTSEPGGSGNRLHIDHDHATGIIRGLLCTKCNCALGLFKDSKDTLKAAISYLDR